MPKRRTDMSTLLELQMRLRRAVLGGDTGEIVAAIQGDGLDLAARVGIYRHHAFTTLGDALQTTFPVVCRLVNKRFFAYAAHEYLRKHPPHSRCLVEYGADFADFRRSLEPRIEPLNEPPGATLLLPDTSCQPGSATRGSPSATR